MIARLGMSRGHRPKRPWYVDSVNGDDGNPGKSAAAALRTIGAVIPRIQPGDTVALAAGSHWREMFAAPQDNVHVVAYGTGAKPLLDCSDAIVPSPWEAWKPTLSLPATFATWQTYLLQGITSSGVSPDGVTSAFKIMESVDASAPHIAYANVTLGPGTYHFSVFLKAGERTWAWTGANMDSSGWHKVCVNLATGQTGTVDSNVSAVVTAIGNGWQRVDLTFTAAVSAGMIGVGITSADGGGSLNDYSGSAGSGIYAWYPATGVWSVAAGTTHVYQASVSIDTTPSKTFVSVWEDDVRLVRATSVANCDATAGSYFPSAEDSSPITLYIHPSDGSNPGSNGKRYEYSKRRHGLDPNGHAGIVFRGLWTRRNLHNDGSLICAAQTYDCLASEGSYHNIYVGPGCYLENVEALDAYWPQGGRGVLVVYNANSPNGDNITFRNCWFHCTAYNPLMDGADGHVNVSGKFGTILFDNCRADNCYYGISTNNAASTMVTGGSSTNCHRALAPGSDTFTIANFGATAIYKGIETQLGTTSATVTNFNCLITGGWACFGIYVGSSNFTLDLEQSTIFGTGVFAVNCGATGFTFHAHQNTIATTGYFWNISSANPVIDSDNNTFQNVSGNRMNIAGTDYTLAAYKTATGQDAHSTP